MKGKFPFFFSAVPLLLCLVEYLAPGSENIRILLSPITGIGTQTNCEKGSKLIGIRAEKGLGWGKQQIEIGEGHITDWDTGIDHIGVRAQN